MPSPATPEGLRRENFSGNRRRESQLYETQDHRAGFAFSQFPLNEQEM
jgi:hypothetical protein